MNIKNIIWDFDGVIIDSVPTKTEAFAYIFQDFPKDKVSLLLKYHQDNGGISRFEKIQYFFSSILQQELSQQKAQHYADEFARFSLAKLYDPIYLIKPTIHFIKAYHHKYPMHIASGAWEVDLMELCVHHGLADYFVSIHGSPTPKTQWVGYIIKQYGYNPKQTCIIGDSIQDYQAAKDNGIAYYGFNNEQMKPYADVYCEDFTYLEGS